MVVEVPRSDGNGAVRQMAHPIKYSATPPAYRRTGVSAGTHTREVMAEIGFGAEEIADFEKTGLFS
jgi:crotonobetainyl-CoA:carnitine CoA-transferase CaiB-like acyl-CoA transferase